MTAETHWQPCCGPVACRGTVTGDPPRLVRDVVTVGNRVKAAWQDYGWMLGTATVVAFRIDPRDCWVQVGVCPDRSTGLGTVDANGVEWWDWDRVDFCVGHWDGETQEESVGRWLASLSEDRS